MLDKIDCGRATGKPEVSPDQIHNYAVEKSACTKFHQNGLLVIEARQAVKGKGAGRASPALSLITSPKH
jgi:hypothetical protein